MPTSKERSAIKASVAFALLLVASVAGAASIGTVTGLDGTLLVTRANGSVKVLALDSGIEQGDILSSRSKTYVKLTLSDDSTVTLGPDTDLKVERFVYGKHVRDNDGAQFALARGSVGITAGLLGTRDGDTSTLATPTGTLEIRGASLVVEYVAPDRKAFASRVALPRDSRSSNMVAVSFTPGADSGFIQTASHSNTLRLAQSFLGAVPPAGAKAPGLYVQVIDGLINLSNKGGSQSFAAGQFGYTGNLTLPPVVLPANPGLKFTPPPQFSAPAGATGSTAGTKANSVDCQVR